MKSKRTKHATWGQIVKDFGNWISSDNLKDRKAKVDKAISDLPKKRDKNVKVNPVK